MMTMMTMTKMKTMARTLMTNPTKAKKTKKMQTSIQAAMAVIPSTFGEFVVTMLKMLISTFWMVFTYGMVMVAWMDGMVYGGFGPYDSYSPERMVCIHNGYLVM